MKTADQRPGVESRRLASRGDIVSFEQCLSAPLDEAYRISRCGIIWPVRSAYYAHNLSMPEPVSFGHVPTPCHDF
jgi:hypothetical protein